MSRYIVMVGNGARWEVADAAQANLLVDTYLASYAVAQRQRERAADMLGIDADTVARADAAVPTEGVYIPRGGAGRFLSGGD